MSEVETAEAQDAASPEKRTVKRLFLRGSMWSLVQYGSGQLIRLASNLILWRLLFPDAFGLMAIVNSVIIALSMLSDIGIGQNVIRHERGDDPDFLNTVWTIQVGRAIALTALAMVAAGPVARFYGQPELTRLIPVVSLGVLVAGFNSTKLFTAMRRMALGRLTVIETVSQLGGLIAMNVWALIHPSVWALAGGAGLGSVIKLVLSHVALPGVRNRLRWERRTLTEVSHFGRWVFVSTLLLFCASSSDRLIFGKLVSIERLGVYSIAGVWATIPGYVAGHVIGNVLYPIFSQVKRSDLAATFRELRGTVLIAAAWMVTCLIAGGPALITFLYDSRAVEAGLVIQFLVIGSWFTTLEAANAAAIMSLGDVKWLAFGNGAKFAAMLVLMPIAGILFGFEAAVLAFSLSDVVRFAVSAKACAKIGLNPLRQDVLLSGGVAIVSLIGLGVGLVARWLALPIANVRARAFTEGAVILLVVSAVWAGVFLSRRRRLRGGPSVTVA